MGGRRKVDGQGHMAKASGALTERRGLLGAIEQGHQQRVEPGGGEGTVGVL